MSRRLDTMESIYSSSVRPVATPEEPTMEERVPMGGPAATYIPKRIHNDSLRRSQDRKTKRKKKQKSVGSSFRMSHRSFDDGRGRSDSSSVDDRSFEKHQRSFEVTKRRTKRAAKETRGDRFAALDLEVVQERG